MPGRPLLDRIELTAPPLTRAAAIGAMRLPGPVRRRILSDAFDRAADAFNRGDLEVVFAAFAKDVDYLPPEPLPGAGPMRGKQAVTEFWREVFERFDENRIENLELEELRPGSYLRRAAVSHRDRESGDLLRYEIEQTTRLRRGQVVRQLNLVS